ncbi:MAG: isoprenyl transferase [Candidatus Omnitrophica bacterium]|nr:isoprenyl transferase [Candidatus Omnitrophota bacterium]
MKVPKHIAIIMDGNGRWAKSRGLPRTMGHLEGSKRFREIVKESLNLGIKALTAFAFSTENWARSKKEVDFLFNNMAGFVKTYKKELIANGAKFNFIGRRDRLPQFLVGELEKLEAETYPNKKFILNVALDYGGRWDIVEAAKKIAVDYKNNKIKKENIDELLFSDYLSLSGICPPDLLIRTSGEKRISNFLLWDLAYAEFYFTDIHWPDFKKSQLHLAVEEYSKRDRRFGRDA